MDLRHLIKYAMVAPLLAAGCQSSRVTEPAASLEDFQARLERLRVEGHIHTISAVIARDGAVAWSRSLGNADAAGVGDTTSFHLASLTKPMASAVILQLVEEGKVALDDSVSKYGIVLANSGAVRVRHLMSHTSEGVPGTQYNYNGNRFSLLDSVIVRATGKSVAAAIHERIVVPLGLRHTAPAPQSPAFSVTGYDQATYLANLAPGFTWNGNRFAPTAYETFFNSAAGLIASARDYAAFSIALDGDALLTSATRTLAYTAATSPTGATFPYGLGWFVTDYKGVRVIWHYGLWTASSTLVIKVPSRALTFVLLANTDGLSAPYPLAAGRLETSPWAREFLETFVIAGLPLP
ncbi:MAG TPA: serine hydrolase domain-containing protein [Longimicrobiales bacterium]